ncbi:MAG: oxidoreductase [Gammaproteobacteria bacterium]|nr:oxidoreductase [Gammaproteobacteria bacterium]
MTFRITAQILAASVLTLLFAVQAAAEAAALETPEGEVILTVKGNIARPNSREGAEFDLPMLEKLPQKTVKTSTRWTEGTQIFQGVLVTELLSHVEAAGEKIQAIALDGYASPLLPVSDMKKYGVIMALKKNGKYLKIRDKGPIWLMYPLDDFPELKNDKLTQYKLIWHLRALEVK